MFFTILINSLLTIHIIVSILIVLVVLMQRPKSEGLGAAFGGGMTESLFGAQTTNVLANFTRYLCGIFFLLTLTLSVLYAKYSTASDSSVKQHLMNAPTPAAAKAAPAPAAVVPAAAPAALGTATAPTIPVPAVSEQAAPAASSTLEASPMPSTSPSVKPEESAGKKAAKD